ncbi:hypothetical protein CR969_01125 [Candidatus Saccharibacteria bacterium]|nr:MAG: hypothetical protein CR969_01125 [Candidatus Saccharibacteria bacterium]
MKQSKSGFTILELIIVMVAIVILAMIAIVSYSTIAPKMRDSKRRADVDVVAKKMQAHAVKNGKLAIGGGDSSMIKISGGVQCKNIIKNGSDAEKADRLNNFSGCSMWASTPSVYPAIYAGLRMEVNTESPEVWKAMTQQIKGLDSIEHAVAPRDSYCLLKNSSDVCTHNSGSLVKGGYSIAISNAYVANSSSEVEICLRVSFVPEDPHYKAPDGIGNQWIDPYAKYICTPGYPSDRIPKDVIY